MSRSCTARQPHFPNNFQPLFIRRPLDDPNLVTSKVRNID